jgi:hypothetical protein
MSSSEVTFAEWLHARNQVGLRIGAWLVMVLLPLTWAFDWSVLPEQAAITPCGVCPNSLSETLRPSRSC